jgi:hypothetical protein
MYNEWQQMREIVTVIITPNHTTVKCQTQQGEAKMVMQAETEPLNMK